MLNPAEARNIKTTTTWDNYDPEKIVVPEMATMIIHDKDDEKDGEIEVKMTNKIARNGMVQYILQENVSN
jgi:hypothetical protein